ncbi:uncharacterized protein LOC111378538 [Olea europaea var. sylvestris]|uniref:uncharacterized protein LOC111378538 n=1 Tax=Olea europaea var. sylvestris TaxID=158386 RepID=UPI000C1D3B29|nr:uncharacterized protein LOC111378538 [Olea europaea var. sylvestris]
MADVEKQSTDDSNYDVYDDDDSLFDRSVRKGIEMDMHTMVEYEEDLELHSSSYATSEELKFGNSSDSEYNRGQLTYPKYYDGNEKKNPHLEVGLLFASFDELKSVVRNYVVFNRVEPIFKRNDKDRVHCFCKDGCPWKLWVSKLQDRDTVQIKTCDPKYICFKVRANKYANYKWLAEYYLEDFKVNPKWKTKHFRTIVRKDFGSHITKVVAWNSRKYAKVLVERSDEKQFALLWRYGAELRKTNPGSIVIISQVDNVLRGKYGGQLLAAIGVDANDSIYLIAYAIVEKENTSSWRWFLMLLAEDLSIENWVSVTFMSDREKGLVKVVVDLFPVAEHRFCIRHMYQNFFRREFTGKYLKDCLWGPTKSSHLASFKHWMSKIETASPTAYRLLKAKPPSEWNKGNEIKDYVSELFTIDTYLSTYEHFIYPMNDKELWPETEQPLVKHPPWFGFLGFLRWRFCDSCDRDLQDLGSGLEALHRRLAELSLNFLAGHLLLTREEGFGFQLEGNGNGGNG